MKKLQKKRKPKAETTLRNLRRAINVACCLRCRDYLAFIQKEWAK